MRYLKLPILAACLALICTACDDKAPSDKNSSATKQVDWNDVSNAMPNEIIAELRHREGGGAAHTFSAEAQPKMSRTRRALQWVDSHTLAKLYEVKIESIYGPDRRRDLTDLAPGVDDAVISLADGVPAVFPKSRVVDNKDRTNVSDLLDGTSTLVLTNFGLQRQLCIGQRFSEQPTGASGTAGVVGTNLILTVGHCLTGPLESHVFVFGFRMLNQTSAVIRVSNHQIYRPIRVVGVSSNDADWAVVEVDRYIESHPFLRVARYDSASPDPTRRAIATGEAIFAIGYPCGLPLKITPMAQVQGNELASPSFLANLTTFAGNSGSPVFAKHGDVYEIVGVLCRGLTDFDFVSERNCRIALRYPEDQGGEECTRSTQFASLIPQIR